MQHRSVRFWALGAVAILAVACAGPRGTGGPSNQSYDDSAGDDSGSGGAGGPGGSAGSGKNGGPGGPGMGGKADGEMRFSPVQMLLRYDANHDGKVTRAELEAGLKAEFEAADLNHDNKLEIDEVRAVNDKRWKDQAAAASPLVDWNGDGVVDFQEFAGAARSLFAQMDADGDGVLSVAELHPGQVQKKPDDKKGKGAAPGAQGGPGDGPGGPGGTPRVTKTQTM